MLKIKSHKNEEKAGLYENVDTIRKDRGFLKGFSISKDKLQNNTPPLSFYARNVSFLNFGALPTVVLHTFPPK